MLAILSNNLRTDRLQLGHYLDQIEHRLKKLEPQFLTLVPEPKRFSRLRREANMLLSRYTAKSQRPPLFGILFGVKDIIHVRGLPTLAGGTESIEGLKGRESSSVTRLKRLGALVLGKTVTTDYANLTFAPGPTRNPLNPNHTPGGSSSGSAAAIAAGFCSLALGSQTVGSLLRPASFCGVVGYKPSYSRIPCDGVISLAPSLDHVGLLTTRVEDVALVARALCREWRTTTTKSTRRKPVLGVPEGPYLERASRKGLQHFRSICKRLEESGYSVRHVSALQDFERISQAHHLILAAEAAQIYKDRFKQQEAKTPELIETGRTVSQDVLQQLLAAQIQTRKRLEALMQLHNVDLWISPAAPGFPPRGLQSTGDAIMNLPWTYSGLPTLSIPGEINRKGLPLGLQVSGRWWADEALIRWGEDLEHVL